MKRIYKILFLILVILLFFGTIIIIALGNIDFADILKKIP